MLTSSYISEQIKDLKSVSSLLSIHYFLSARIQTAVNIVRMSTVYFDPEKVCPSDRELPHSLIPKFMPTCPKCGKKNMSYQAKIKSVPQAGDEIIEVSDSPAGEDCDSSTTSSVPSASPTKSHKKTHNTLATSISNESEACRPSTSIRLRKGLATQIHPEAWGEGQKALQKSVAEQPRKKPTEYPTKATHECCTKVHLALYDLDRPTGYDVCDYKVPFIFEDIDIDSTDLMQLMIKRLPNAAVRKDAKRYMPTEDTVDDYMFTTVTPTNKPGGLDLAIYCQKMRASKLSSMLLNG
jgi:hypothetical protein